MGNKLPLGVYSRGRRDMGITDLAMGSVAQNGGSQASLIFLNNNSTAGQYLAVYGILAWRQSSPQLVIAWTKTGLDTHTAGTVQMLDPRVGQIPGTVTTSTGSTNTFPSLGLIWVADGKSWFNNGDVPLIIIPPNQTLFVYPYTLNIGTPPIGEAMVVTFLWGLYKDPTPPQLKASASA